MKQALAEEKANGCIPVWEDESDFVENESDMGYSAYREGFWCENHYELSILKIPMRTSPAFLRKAAEHYDIQSKQNDFLEQTESWGDTYRLPDGVLFDFLHSKEIASIVEEKLNKNDSYWEAYWKSFSEVAHEMYKKAEGVFKDGNTKL